MTAAFNALDQDKHLAAIERQLDSLEDAVAVLQGADHLLTADGELWLATQQRMPPSERVRKSMRGHPVSSASEVSMHRSALKLSMAAAALALLRMHDPTPVKQLSDLICWAEGGALEGCKARARGAQEAALVCGQGYTRSLERARSQETPVTAASRYFTCMKCISHRALRLTTPCQQACILQQAFF